MQTQTSNTLHNAIMDAGSKDRPPMLAPVDACPNACEMWKAIKRLKQGESINVQDLKTNLYWEFGKFTSQDDEETSKDKEIDKLMALISLSFKKIYKPTNNNLRTSSNTSRANQDNSPGINRNAGYENQRIGNVAGARENVEDQELEAHYMYMEQLQEVSPDAADSRPIFNDEPLQKVSNDDQYNVFAMESTHPEQSKYVHDTYPIEQDAQNVIIDSLDMSDDREEIYQNDDDNDLSKERELLASLIEKLKCEINESKNHNKFLKTSNKVLIEKLKGEIEDFKTKNKILESSYNFLKEANNKLSETNNLLYADYKKSEAELARRNSTEYASQMELECAKAREMKDKLSAHQETIFILSKQKEAQIKLYKTREDKELDKVIELENKEMVVDLRYFNSLESEVDSLKSQLESQKTQFVNEIDRLSREYYYADHMNAILGVYTELDAVTNLHCDYLELLEKCEGLEIELSKSKMMSNSFESIQKHAINLELELQQCKEKIKNDMLFKLKGKSVDTKFEKSLVIRQPNAFKSHRPSVLGKPTTFSNSFVRKDLTSVTQTHVSNDFSKPVTAQTLPSNKKSILKNTNVLAPGMYKLHTDHTQTRTSQLPQDSRKTNKRVSFSTGVILTTSVSRPQLKSNPQRNRVMHNNSQRKKQEVEDHRRSVKLSKNKTSVTACNGSLNAKTLNVKFVSAMCDKCVLIDKHDMCVLNSVAKPIKRTVASESNKKPRNFTRKLYKSVSKTCSWWYPKFTPSGYKWKPKSEKENVNPNLVEIVLFIVDSGCSKYMTGNLKLLINFVEKFLGTVKFGNDQIAPILGYGNLVQGAVMIKKVYYVKGLNHNLFSVGQFCNADLEVAFRKSTCFIRDLKGNDLLTVTAQTLPPNKRSIIKNTNALAPGMYKLHAYHNQARTSQLPQDSRKTNKRVSFSTGVIPTTNVSRPQLKSNPIGDSHHMCVLNFVAKSLKKTVASESNQKPKNITRKLYERVSKTCSWWYPKFTPSGYKWKPKSGQENVNPNLVEIVLFIVDSGCSKHMTGNLKLLINFVEKFLGTVKFGYDQIAPILGYGDLGNNLLTGSRGTDLYSITLQDTYSPNPICLMAKVTSSQAWLWHCRHSHLNFDTINLLSKNDIVTLHAYFPAEGILYQTSVAQTPEQNDVVERHNCTLVEAARTMLSAAKVPLFFWAEAIATACFTQNRSLVIPRHEKTPYHIINDQKPLVKFFYIFGSLCYIVRDGENLDKMKEKGDACIFVGYSTQSRAYRVFNKRTRVIMVSIHVNFDELPQMASDQLSSDSVPKCQTMALNHDSLSPAIQHQENVTQVDRTVITSNELDFLFSLMFDELLNGSSKIVSKPSAITAADAPYQRQHHITPLNIHTTPTPTCQVTTLAPSVISSENINQAETYAKNDQVADDEFINIFSTPVQDQGETSLHHVDSSNMHTFYQRYPSEHHHPPEQVIGNPSQSVRARRQLESNAKMCMFALTEKGDECIFVGYSTQSKAYRVVNKRTRVIMESIYVNFDELPQMASDQTSSDPVPECQTTTLNHDSLSTTNQRQANVTQADRTITPSNELDLLFSPMFDELPNGSSKVVSKSSATKGRRRHVMLFRQICTLSINDFRLNTVRQKIIH
nr:hypothetical protein [Tanacetum cinerariifolium]